LTWGIWNSPWFLFKDLFLFRKRLSRLKNTLIVVKWSIRKRLNFIHIKFSWNKRKIKVKTLLARWPSCFSTYLGIMIIKLKGSNPTIKNIFLIFSFLLLREDEFKYEKIILKTLFSSIVELSLHWIDHQRHWIRVFDPHRQQYFSWIFFIELSINMRETRSKTPLDQLPSCLGTDLGICLIRFVRLNLT
jgi:hypothetical protein